MRILYVTHGGGAVGGIQTYGSALADGMHGRGHQVETIDCGADLWKQGLTLGDHLPGRFALRRFYWWRTSFLHDYRFHNAVGRLCTRAARVFRPDVVHCLHVYTPAAHFSAIAPSIVTCHGLEIEDIPPVRTSIGAAAAVHCNSEFTRRRVIATLGDRRGVRVLRWGIKPIPRSPLPACYDLVTVGRVVKRKNLDTVLRALSGLRHLTYAIAGEGPELGALKQLAGELGLSNVQFLGTVSDEQKARLLSQSRAFVMCPRGDDPADVEGLGLVYFEAHGASLPVIGSSSGGAPEAIGDGGVLVRNPQDVDELRAVIARALEPATHQALVRAVLARHAVHSWDRFLGAFESWYEALAATALERHSVFSARARSA